MNAIIGMTGLLLRHRADGGAARVRRDDPRQRRGAADDHQRHPRLLQDRGRQAGAGARSPSTCATCVESALDLLAARAAEKGLDLAYLIEPGAPAGHPAATSRACARSWSTCSATRSSSPTAARWSSPSRTRQCAAAEERRIAARSAVRDTGIGIPPDRVDRLFRSFSQVDASTTRRYGGTGLGLAISKRLSELMGGTMWVESAGVGSGATFHFTVRTAPVDAPAPSFLVGSAAGAARPAAADRGRQRHQPAHPGARTPRAWGMAHRDTASPREALELGAPGRALRRRRPGHADAGDGRGGPGGGHPRARAPRRRCRWCMLTSLGRRDVGPPRRAASPPCCTKPIKPSQLFDALVQTFSPAAQPAAGDGQAAAENRVRRHDGRRGCRCASCWRRTTRSTRSWRCTCWPAWATAPTSPPTAWKCWRRSSGSPTTWC